MRSRRASEHDGSRASRATRALRWRPSTRARSSVERCSCTQIPPRPSAARANPSASPSASAISASRQKWWRACARRPCSSNVCPAIAGSLDGTRVKRPLRGSRYRPRNDHQQDHQASIPTELEILDDRFRDCRGDDRVERVELGCRWAEGPVYVPAGRYLLVSDIPNDRILRWDEITGAVGEFRNPSGYANGNTLDAEGRLVTCEHGHRRVTRTEHDGSITVLADRYEGKRFNSPNDVVVRSDGSVWFTDPSYGIDSDYEGHRAESEIGGCHVYRLDPATGACHIVADDFVRPNGLAFSLDETQLYIADSRVKHIRVFDVRGDALAGGRLFAEGAALRRDPPRRPGPGVDRRPRRGAVLRPRRHSHRPTAAAGDHVQHRVRRTEAQLAVHLRHDLGVLDHALRQRCPAGVGTALIRSKHLLASGRAACSSPAPPAPLAPESVAVGRLDEHVRHGDAGAGKAGADDEARRRIDNATDAINRFVKSERTANGKLLLRRRGLGRVGRGFGRGCGRVRRCG